MNIPEIYWAHSPASLALISPHVSFASATSRHAPESQPQPTSFKLLTFPSAFVPPWTAMAWVCQSTRHSLDTTSTSPFPQPPPVTRPILPPITLLCTQSHLPTRVLANAGSQFQQLDHPLLLTLVAAASTGVQSERTRLALLFADPTRPGRPGVDTN
jgi:hypothetical protein